MAAMNATKISMLRKAHGFTIVELLIVIVVIGILAAIAISAYNGSQERARAAAVSSGIKKIEKAFHLLAIEQSRTTWWGDASASLTGTANPLISDIITATNMKSYLQAAPDVSGIPTGFWWYDNDADTYDPAECLASISGVNIAFTNIPSSTALIVDKSIDDGNLNCGAVRYNTASGGRLFYALSNNQQM